MRSFFPEDPMKRIFMLLLPVIFCVYWFFFLRFLPPPPLEISRETTFFTDVEMRADGKVPLAPALNRLYGAKPENNAVIEMLQIYGRDSVATDSGKIADICSLLQIDAATISTPALSSAAQIFFENAFTMTEGAQDYYLKAWHENDHPQLAEAIADNEPVFRLLESMAAKKAFFFPFRASDPVWNSQTQRSWRPHMLSRMLVARGMNHLANAKLNDAWHDLKNGFKIGQLICSANQAIYSMIGIFIVRECFFSTVHLLNHKNLDEALAVRIFNDLKEISIADKIFKSVEFEQRFFMLSIFLENPETIGEIVSISSDPDAKDSEIIRHLDLNIICRKINQGADEIASLTAITNPVDRLQQLQIYQDQLYEKRKMQSQDLLVEILWAQFLTPSQAKSTRISELIWKILNAVGQPDQFLILKEAMSVGEMPRLLQAGAQARLHELRTGKFPVSLSELAEENRPWLTDVFANDYFKVKNASEGLLIYSIGLNLEDDGGIVASSDAPEDDFGLTLYFQNR